jgi:hypothetical protein
MSLLDKWILSRAKKIEAKEKALYESETQKRKTISDSMKLVKEILIRRINKEAKELADIETHINIGDKAILNVYSLCGKNGSNGWDGGASSLIKNIPKGELNEPVTVEISEIYVDISLAEERVGRFVDNLDNDLLLLIMNNEKLVFEEYDSWLINRTGSDDYGLYKTAYFKYDGTFQPKWGLNIDSFLKEGTVEYNKTNRIWKKELKLNSKISELSKQLKELDNEREKIKEELFNHK